MLLPISIVIVACIILLGNGLTITAIARFRSLQTLTNYFVASLASADCLLGLILFYYAAYELRVDLHTIKVACLMRYSLTFYSFASSLFSITALTVERYIALKFPYRYATWMTTKTVKILIALAWILALVVGFVPVYSNHWQQSDPKCKYAFQVITYPGAMVVLVPWFFCLLIMIIAYARIYYEAMVQTRKIQALEICFRQSRKEHKTTMTIFCIVGVFMFCWLPFGVMFWLLESGEQSQAATTVYMITVNLAAVNSCINPVIYGWKNRGFRKAYIQLLRCGRKRDTPSGIIANSNNDIREVSLDTNTP